MRAYRAIASRPFAAGAVGSLLLAGLFFAWLRFSLGGAAVTQAVDDIGEAIVALGAGAACTIAAVRAGRGARRRGWALLGASAMSWGLGEVVWSTYELVLHVDVPFPSLADVGYLGAVPLAALGLLMLAEPLGNVQMRIRAVMDGLLISTALLFVSWSLVLRPVASASSGSTFQQAIALAYPAGDVVVATIAVYAAAHAPSGGRRPVLLVALAAAALALADSGFAFLTTAGDYATGNLIDGGWVAGYLALSLAALDAITRRAPERAPAGVPHLASVMLPYAPFGAALIVASFDIASGTVDLFLVWTGFFGLLFLVTRQLLHIVDHIETSDKLARANEDLRRVEAFRAQLLNNVSHDLATPLTPVLMQLYLLGKSDLPEPQKRALVVMRRNVEQLQRLVTDVKDVARLQAGGLKLQPAVTDVAKLVTDCVESFHGAADERGVRLDLLVESTLPARADAQRITQVAFNLITNALKFTPRGGWILVRARAEGDDIVVDVADSGRGISPEDQRKLFQPFVQVHDATQVQEKGSGLGLYISRGIMQQHGGDLSCQSAGHGRGTTFTLRLPLLRALELHELQQHPVRVLGMHEGDA